MLPVLRRSLTHALSSLGGLDQGAATVRLRVGLWDGSVVEGTLLSASEKQLSVLLPGAQARLVRVDEIRSVYRARRRPLRWLAVVAGGILTATAVIVGMSEVPLLRAHMPRAVGVFLILGAALAMQVVARTDLGAWLTAWEAMFEAPDRQPDHLAG
jgi:hypothetical protein